MSVEPKLFTGLLDKIGVSETPLDNHETSKPTS
jgi:hypothetical protein